jgi:hypothetical protein
MLVIRGRGRKRVRIRVGGEPPGRAIESSSSFLVSADTCAERSTTWTTSRSSSSGTMVAQKASGLTSLIASGSSTLSSWPKATPRTRFLTSPPSRRTPAQRSSRSRTRARGLRRPSNDPPSCQSVPWEGTEEGSGGPQLLERYARQPASVALLSKSPQKKYSMTAIRTPDPEAGRGIAPNDEHSGLCPSEILQPSSLCSQPKLTPLPRLSPKRGQSSPASATIASAPNTRLRSFDNSFGKLAEGRRLRSGSSSRSAQSRGTPRIGPRSTSASYERSSNRRERHTKCSGTRSRRRRMSGVPSKSTCARCSVT